MMNKRNLRLGVVSAICVILIAVIIIIVVATGAHEGPRSCPTDYLTQPPLILVSLDGFRADYRDRGLTPVINRLAEEGVSAPYMISVFPTVTFSNHYTIVTGLYPESHGIVANKFRDPELGQFSLSKPEGRNGAWWGGEPMWNTLARQSKKSATYFWPGSEADIDGGYPTYWYPYKKSAPYEERVDQVLEWVKMKAESRPAWITVYFSEPDNTGHTEGPDSEAVNKKLIHMDGIVDQLVTGLEDAHLLDCVNLILTADHGMAGGGKSEPIKLLDYVPDLEDSSDIYTGAFTMISPFDKSAEAKYEIMKNLTCQRPDMRVYEKAGLPKRFHYSNNRRIGDIVLSLEGGRVALGTVKNVNNGNHGYDYYFKAMNALFLARGPGFKSGVITKPFQNIELYNLMCHLTGVSPAPNNGTPGVFNDILTNPISAFDLPKVERLRAASYPGPETLLRRLNVSGCAGDVSAPEDWLSALDYTAEVQSDLEIIHAPWGLPQLQGQNLELTLLHQPDHVTAYSPTRRMPVWTSFTIEGQPAGSLVSSWASDVRLGAASSATCAHYDGLPGVVMAPLFHPGFSSNSSLYQIPYIVSNAVPSTAQQQQHWNDFLRHLVPVWLGGGGLNLVLGPVFDGNTDSLADPYVDNDNGSSLELPSDLFAIVTRCMEETAISECRPERLETRAFIIPAEQVVDNCLDARAHALEFSCTVKDVRTATSLAFFPQLPSDVRVRLETAVHQSIW